MEIKIESPLDMHLHLRDGEMLNLTVPASSKTFSGALVMPNLEPPITTREEAANYKARILSVCEGDLFEPYMTLFFKDSYSQELLASARKDILAVKLYPKGATTHSAMGVVSPLEPKCMEVIGMLEKLGIPLCIHGETGGFVLDREREFIPIYEELARSFKNLKIIMEHITTRELVELLERHENLYATVTLHHLLITLDDVIGGMLNPHNFCKPIPKTPADREALRAIALSAHPKVMFGSDSAPHPRGRKEACCGAAGVFSAPIALELLAEIFEDGGALDKLWDFVSGNARRIYGISPPRKTVILREKEHKIEEAYGEVVPFMRGKTLRWSVAEVV
ncbi:MAG: dihydroorotase [Candidatus Methanosuratincola sp.]|jgi:dihydroorotase